MFYMTKKDGRGRNLSIAVRALVETASASIIIDMHMPYTRCI